MHFRVGQVRVADGQSSKCLLQNKAGGSGFPIDGKWMKQTPWSSLTRFNWNVQWSCLMPNDLSGPNKKGNWKFKDFSKVLTNSYLICANDGTKPKISPGRSWDFSVCECVCESVQDTRHRGLWDSMNQSVYGQAGSQIEPQTGSEGGSRSCCSKGKRNLLSLLNTSHHTEVSYQSYTQTHILKRI